MTLQKQNLQSVASSWRFICLIHCKCRLVQVVGIYLWSCNLASCKGCMLAFSPEFGFKTVISSVSRLCAITAHIFITICPVPNESLCLRPPSQGCQLETIRDACHLNGFLENLNFASLLHESMSVFSRSPVTHSVS